MGSDRLVVFRLADFFRHLNLPYFTLQIQKLATS